jgi:hypothetical protein
LKIKRTKLEKMVLGKRKQMLHEEKVEKEEKKK